MNSLICIDMIAKEGSTSVRANARHDLNFHSQTLSVPKFCETTQNRAM